MTINKANKELPSYFKRLLIHEYFLLGFILLTMARLALTPQKGWLAYYFFIFAAYMAVAVLGMRIQSTNLNRFRLFFAFIIMTLIYNSIKYIVPILETNTIDDVLSSIDKFMVGGDLSIKAQSIYSKPLTEILNIAYILHFLPMGLGLLVYGFFSDIKKAYNFYAGLFTVFAIGFFGYTLVPAVGPFVHFAGQYTKELVGYFFTPICIEIVKLNYSVYDVFPSIHTGVALYLLLFFYKNNRSIFKFYLPLFILIIISTIYLRYHYLIDVICGAILSVVVFFLVNKRISANDEVKYENSRINLKQ